jgi:hypothetical protein
MSTTTPMAKMTVARNKPSDRKCTVAESAPSFMNERASAPRPKTNQNIAFSDCERNAHRASIQRQVVSSNEDSIELADLQRQQRLALSAVRCRGLHLVERFKSESLNPRGIGNPHCCNDLENVIRTTLAATDSLSPQAVLITVSNRTIL